MRLVETTITLPPWNDQHYIKDQWLVEENFSYTVLWMPRVRRVFLNIRTLLQSA